jgi:hypothetical protein
MAKSEPNNEEPVNIYITETETPLLNTAEKIKNIL